MFCQNCGARNADANRFCTRCGQPVSVSAAPAPVPTPAPVNPPVQNYYAPAGRTVNDDRKKQAVIAAYKKVAGSPLTLIAVIAYTLSILLSVVSAINLADNTAIYGYLEAMGVSYWEIYDMMDRVETYGILMTLIALIPSLVILIGLWLIYASGKSHAKRTSTAGLTTIKVLTIVQLVFLCIAVGLLLVLLLIAIFAATNYDTAMSGALLLVFLLVCGICAFAIVYMARIISSLSKAANTVRTGEADHRVSGFVAVILFIAAAFSLLGAVGYLSMATGTLMIVSSLLSAIVNSLFGALIFVYKSAMRKVEDEPFIPAAVPVYNPQPVYSAPYNPAPVRPVAPAPVAPQPVAPVVPEPVVSAPTPEATEPAVPNAAAPEQEYKPVDPEPAAPELEYKPVDLEAPAPAPAAQPVQTIIAKPPAPGSYDPVQTVIARPPEPVQTIIAKPPMPEDGETTVLNPQDSECNSSDQQ